MFTFCSKIKHIYKYIFKRLRNKEHKIIYNNNFFFKLFFILLIFMSHIVYSVYQKN